MAERWQGRGIDRHGGASTSQLGWKSEEVGELAGPEAAAPVRLEAGHHGGDLGEVGQLVSVAHYEEVLEAVGRFSAVVVQRPRWVAAAGRKESEVGLGVRKGLVRLEQRTGWERLDVVPAC